MSRDFRDKVYFIIRHILSVHSQTKTDLLTFEKVYRECHIGVLALSGKAVKLNSVLDRAESKLSFVRDSSESDHFRVVSFLVNRILVISKKI